MVWIKRLSIKIEAFNTFVALDYAFALSLLAMGLGIACGALHTKVSEVEGEVRVCRAWQDVVDTGLAGAADISAAMDAAVAVPAQREPSYGAP